LIPPAERAQVFDVIVEFLLEMKASSGERRWIGTQRLTPQPASMAGSRVKERLQMS